jgi:hypothetical protein
LETVSSISKPPALFFLCPIEKRSYSPAGRRGIETALATALFVSQVARKSLGVSGTVIRSVVLIVLAAFQIRAQSIARITPDSVSGHHRSIPAAAARRAVEVPEASTYLLLGMALIFLACMRPRSRKSFSAGDRDIRAEDGAAFRSETKVPN